eukprot:6880625-Ditylum_brightwellii.AAC.1
MPIACQLWKDLSKVGKGTKTIVLLFISRYVIRNNIQGTKYIVSIDTNFKLNHQSSLETHEGFPDN